MAKNSRADILRERYAKIQKSSQNIQTGTLYIFENHKNHDFSLPVKSYCGKKWIGPRGRFTGDAYFLSFVKTGDLRMIEVLEYKADEPTVINEASEDKMDKLILDQPEKFTTKGHTEHVVVENPAHKKLTEITGENTKNEAQTDVLLNENPLEGIDIING